MTSALPANFASIYVRGQFIDLSGAAVRGTVTFEPAFNDVLIDLVPRVIITKKTFTATLDANGKFTILLPVTDDPDILPVTWTYRVTEPSGRTYNIQVPSATLALSSSGDPLNGQQVIDLAQVVPVGGSSGTVQLVPSIGPQGPQGIQGVQGPVGEVSLATFNGHVNNTSNPHATTKAQVGLGNVDNTSDVNKPISTATQTALNLKADSSTVTTLSNTLAYVTSRAASGTTDTLVLGDAGNAVDYSAATAVAVTVPTNASVAFPLGTVIELCQYGTGQVVVTNTGGTPTLRTGASLTTRAQYSAISLRKKAADEWIVGGDLT